MSRCFPFPPPGYQRKHQTEDLDILIEAKHKDKRQKKDKERRKGREKREKDGSDEKRRNKKERKGKPKDKKEKHRKKKKEDPAKDKEKSSISDESTAPGKHDQKMGEALHPEGHSKDSSRLVDGGTFSALFQGRESWKPFQNSDQKTPTKTAFANHSRVLGEENGDPKEMRVDIRNNVRRVLIDECRGNAKVRNLTGTERSEAEGISRPVEEQIGRRLENRKYGGIGDDKPRDYHIDKDKKSNGKVNDREKKEKVEKKEESAKLKTCNMKSEHDKSSDFGRNGLVGCSSRANVDLLKDCDSSAVDEENIKKRKVIDINGFLHENEIRPHKIQKQAPYKSIENGKKLEGSQAVSKSYSDKHAIANSIRLDNWDRLMNGMKEAQKTSPPEPNPGPSAAMVPPKPNPNPSAAAVVSDQIAEGQNHDSKYLNKKFNMPKMDEHIAKASKRPPHPDSEYLNEVLTVPKVDHWSENDDQEWLFRKKDSLSKPNVEFVDVGKELCVWSEALYVESADVYAMPYVIPY